MGRTKLKLAPLEVGPNRNATYSKRRQGLEKKVLELSILCNIDIMLLTFSPKGKPSFVKSSKSNPEEMIKTFAMLTPEERAKRKTESIEAIKKAFKDFPNKIDLEDPFGLRHHSREDYKAVEEMLQARLSEINQCLNCWKHVDKIENIELLAQMQEILGKALFKIWNSKEIHKRQLLESIRNDRLKQLQLFASTSDHAYQNLDLQREFYVSPHEDTRCSKAIRLEGHPCVPRFSYTPIATYGEGTSNRINDDRSSCIGYSHEHSHKIGLPLARNGKDFLPEHTSRFRGVDFVKLTNEHGISRDPIGTEYDFSELIGTESKDIYFVDVIKNRQEDCTEVGIIDGPFGNQMLTGICPARSENNTSMSLIQNTDMLMNLPETAQQDVFPEEVGIIDGNCGNQMLTGICPARSENNTSMSLIQNTDMLMNLPETAQQDVFPEVVVEMSNKFGEMRPTSMIQNGNAQCTREDNHEIANEDNIFEEILKDIEADYHNKDLDTTQYKEIPDSSFSFPLLCDTFQPGVLNAEQNALVHSTDDVAEFQQSDSSLTTRTCISIPGNASFSASGEYLSPQFINSIDDQKAAYYSDHMNLIPIEFQSSLS